MDQNAFRFRMEVAGMERKEVARLIADHFGTQSVYQGAPSFDYRITDTTGREWLIDKNGMIITKGSVEDTVTEMFAVFAMLEADGVTTTPSPVEITLSTEGHTGVSLRNLVNILAAKEKLIIKAMGTASQALVLKDMIETVNAIRLKTIDDFLEAAGEQELTTGFMVTKEVIVFRFFAATLDPDAIAAYIQFAAAINNAALIQKHSSPHETQTSNEKYSFRVFLLHLGFIGEKYSVSRKLLLAKLSGNGSFRTEEQAKRAVKIHKEHLTENVEVV